MAAIGRIVEEKQNEFQNGNVEQVILDRTSDQLME